MKKLILSLFTFLIISFALLFSSLSVSAYYEYVDVGDDDCCIYYETDYKSGTLTVTDYEPTYNGKVVIPETIYRYDDEYDLCELKIVAMKSYTDCSEVEYIKIPSSVTEIEPYAVGYIKEYDDEFEDWEYIKKDNFTIACSQGSCAEAYAKENGFAIQLLKDINNLKISLGATSFTYTSDEIEPKVTITDGTKKLVLGKDYSVTYANNVKIGTATATVYGMGDYFGTKTIKFTVKPIDASAVKISGISNEEYCAYNIKPYPNITYGKLCLYEGEDYTLSYRNNFYPGTAYVDITFKGNYSGKRTVKFNIYIDPVTELKAQASSSSAIELSWNHQSWDIDYYYVYRYNTKTKEYKYLGKTSYTSYYDDKLTQYQNYKYKVVPVVLNGKKAIKGKEASVSCKTLLSAPTLELTLLKKSVKIKYTKNSKADGYVIYRERLGIFSDVKKLKTVKGNKAGTFTDKSIKTNGTYAYTIRAYKTVGGKKVYGEYSDAYYSNSADAVLRGAVLKSKTSFTVYNKQGKNTTSYTYTLSKNDISILKQFAEKHFTKKMTKSEKLRYTLEWINRNVIYARGENWNKISGKSWVEAAFVEKLGQCAQYNGAMAAMMAYLGYDACVVQGYRGSYPSDYWQHFWCEVKIQGRKYLMETGNYSTDGTWCYFLTPYAETNGYIINQTPAIIAETEPEVSSVYLSKSEYVYNGKVKNPSVMATDTHGNTLTEGKDFTVKYSGDRKKVGKHTVTVTFKGKYSGKTNLTFFITPKAPSLTLKAGSKKLTASWKKVSGVSGYMLQYSTSKDFSWDTTNTYYVESKSTKQIIDSLKKGKKYYVRMKSYKSIDEDSLYSPWSKVKSVTVK